MTIAFLEVLAGIPISWKFSKPTILVVPSYWSPLRGFFCFSGFTVSPPKPLKPPSIPIQTRSARCRASSWFTTGPIKTIDPDTHRIFSRLRLFRRLRIRYRIIRLPSDDPDHHWIPHQSLPSLRMAYKKHRITEMHTGTHHTRHLRLYQRSYGLSGP
jgi:hypothetical protein